MVYRSPFITETDQPAFTDCQFAAGLALVAEWTDGEAILARHGNTLDAVGLRRLRERIRILSCDAVGGASLEDLARGIARRFPEQLTARSDCEEFMTIPVAERDREMVRGVRLQVRHTDASRDPQAHRGRMALEAIELGLVRHAVRCCGLFTAPSEASRPWSVPLSLA
jgi:hypothetical protein